MDKETLEKRKAELRTLIDELQIKMITARGRKLAFMAADLDDLEAEKNKIKEQLNRAEGIDKRKGKGRGKTRRNIPQQQQAKKKESKVQMSEAELAALAQEVEALEKQTLAEEDEADRRYFELYSEKISMYKREEQLYREEQVVLKAMLSTDPTLEHVVKCQRIARESLRRRRWKGGRPMLAPIVERYVRSDVSKAERNRWALVVKIYQSQKAYVESITVAVDKYLVPLRKTNSHASGVTRDDIHKMFGQLEVIAALDVDVLRGLHSRLFGRFTHTAIGDVLVQMSPLFSLYEEYCRTYDVMITTLASLQRSNKLFFKFLGSLYERSGAKPPLTALLELPAQRLFEYKTILGALVKATPQSHADHQYFRSTLSKVSQSVKNVERMQSVKKAAQQLKSLARRISGMPDRLASSGRILTGDKSLHQVSPTPLMVHYYLFNDVLMRTAVTGSKKEKFLDQVPLLGMKLRTLPDSGTQLNAFELTAPGHEPWVVRADSYAEKVHAEKMFRKAFRDQSRVAGMAAERPKQSSLGVYRAKLEAAVVKHSDRLTRVTQQSLSQLKGQGPCMGILECLAAPDGETLRVLSGNKKAVSAALQALDAYDRILKVTFLVAHPELLAAGMLDVVARKWVQAVIGGSADVVCGNVLANAASIPTLFLALVHKAREAAHTNHHTETAANSAAATYLYESLLAPSIENEQVRVQVGSRFVSDVSYQQQVVQNLPSNPQHRSSVTQKTAKDQLLPNIHKHLISNLDKIGPLMSEGPRSKLIDAIAIAIVLQK